MNRQRVSQVGKYVGGALYLHKDALVYCDDNTNAALEKVKTCTGAGVWEAVNVIKLQGAPPARVTLLAYEEFGSIPFPALLEAWTVNIEQGTVRHRNFRRSDNPPILHRKELLLRPDDPERSRYAGLTAELERRGLFSTAAQIGFKEAWAKVLEQAGVRVYGHEVIDVSGARRDGGDLDGR